jgi:hypothetical protein
MKRFFVVIVLCMLSACGKSGSADDSVSLTGIVLNYSQEGYPSVSINGHGVGVAVKRVKIGDVYGGGSHMCCFPLSRSANQVNVELTLHGGSKVVVAADIEQPWSEMPNTAGIHILPGRKIVIEVTPGGSQWPRMDLLDARIKELGLKKEVDYQAKMQEIMRKQQQPQNKEEDKK